VVKLSWSSTVRARTGGRWRATACSPRVKATFEIGSNRDPRELTRSVLSFGLRLTPIFVLDIHYRQAKSPLSNEDPATRFITVILRVLTRIARNPLYATTGRSIANNTSLESVSSLSSFSLR